MHYGGELLQTRMVSDLWKHFGSPDERSDFSRTHTYSWRHQQRPRHAPRVILLSVNVVMVAVWQSLSGHWTGCDHREHRTVYSFSKA